ncbi:MAG: DUF4834 family protein [Prevotella sp.]|nr:DUF4834 family protein [Prevotella sp.]
MFILKFLLILLIAFIVTIGAFVWRVFRGFNNARKHFQDMGQQDRQPGNNSKNPSIIDQRTPEEANRKIIPDNEGEYVDYEDA